MASFHRRLIGAIGLNAATYEEVEHDQTATLQAGAIVAVSSLTTSVAWYFGIGVPAGFCVAPSMRCWRGSSVRWPSG